MKLTDARKIAAVLVTVDDGCLDCATDLVRRMTIQFPAFDWPQLVAAADGDWTADQLRS